MLEFEHGGGLFHLPIRCSTIAQDGGLCDACSAREEKTKQKIKEITGTTIKGTLPSYLMGRVTEPIPYWSRLYGGAWYNLKIQEGCTVSEQNMARVKKALAAAYDGVETREPQPMPAGSRKTRAKANKVELPVAEPAPTTEVVDAPAPKKRVAKKVSVPPVQEEPVAGPPVGVIPEPAQELSVEHVREIKVRRREIDGRNVYLGPKDKVYDLKFKYLGRLKGDAIVSFPDSDEGM